MALKDYSQNGEQEHILHYLDTIGITKGHLVDLGAGDGYTMSKPTPTVSDMQWLVRCWCDQQEHGWITPNAILYHWESDLLSVTRSNLVHEFEIKRSRADLLRDLDKEKHSLRYLLTGKREAYSYDIGGRRINRPPAEIKRPSYFWFVVTEELVDVALSERIPAHCGVMEIRYAGDQQARPFLLEPRRMATRLHETRIDAHDLLKLAGKVHYRYWGLVRQEQNKKLKKRVKAMQQIEI